MEFGKVSKYAFLSLVACAAIGLNVASATARIYTATIDSDGNVLSQNPNWVSKVEHVVHQNYFANYQVEFNKRTFNKAPGYCSVSLADTRSADDIYYGQARLGAAPKQSGLSVVTQLAGKPGAWVDSSQSFMLMCVQ
ncbi:hypothetical protein [Pseudomonas sp. UV AK001]|uniref:hypothetical protein n=1 Tax=Pseudomonas sp. UV AK001 TaxID=3384791 RepID=UPI0038D3C80A